MKYKNILSFYSGLILSNIYFAIEDNKKLKQIENELFTYRLRHKEFNR